ncbi:unnamed protein product [Caretta caretta]
MYSEASTMNSGRPGSSGAAPPPRRSRPPGAGAVPALGGIAQISPCLYLCSGNAAANRQLVRARAVTCVVNATMELPNANWPEIDYVKVPVADLPHAPLALYFDSVADRIHQTGKRNGRTLVHCVAGVSRSASLCIAYLMKYHRLSLLDAHQWVRSRRPVVRPNAGFWRQLIALRAAALRQEHRAHGALAPRPAARRLRERDPRPGAPLELQIGGAGAPGPVYLPRRGRLSTGGAPLAAFGPWRRDLGADVPQRGIF